MAGPVVLDGRALCSYRPKLDMVSVRREMIFCISLYSTSHWLLRRDFLPLCLLLFFFFPVWSFMLFSFPVGLMATCQIEDTLAESVGVQYTCSMVEFLPMISK
jgi:hypothetical protein